MSEKIFDNAKAICKMANFWLSFNKEVGKAELDVSGVSNIVVHIDNKISCYNLELCIDYKNEDKRSLSCDIPFEIFEDTDDFDYLKNTVWGYCEFILKQLLYDRREDSQGLQCRNSDGFIICDNCNKEISDISSYQIGELYFCAECYNMKTGINISDDSLKGMM